ncbi:dihydroorotase [Alloalcanivorax profundimaris]|jgi:dihydroorotase|uniref:Dihydroorotase, multifunctional complex type n=1 Tax=Alloalcanivorax profundimaris TaxID=2735259 RepID=A0ABS0AR97_9GAMM|nr:dihydroorotase [Alloalcanivorax profundimaris]MAO58326.1 dihydroorotase [Alcanivorax sp.]MCQ6260328.1 dihydroorotase [Alcanivorax sp. MM125-6]UWN50089.1 Dihydroorotase [Alcanivorax sp. ALC70]MBF1803306.1 dihydroorotase [Alloalcanivorax profundimaris]MBF5056660.1 dihydroorotase, multifunctional complex type [Alloalcanivorax profundimaris]|tara:strand:- start:14572 stop:15852 length:1281 start_codon:yes stop_codon:yes gene_type:complete
MAVKAHLLIRKGRVIDPASGRDEVADLLVEDGRLARIGASLDAPGAEIVEAEGHWVLPGLVDACVHLSVPGSGRAGDIASETRAAAAGGVTHLAAQPDCGPVDSTAVVRLIREQAGQAGFARVLPVAALTQGLEGHQLAEMATLARAGCIAVGQGGAPVADALVLKRGLEYAATFDLPVMFRPQEAALSAGGCAHDGPVATRLGLPGIPAVAESVELARDLLLVEATGVRAHFQQISSRDSLPLLRAAKARGLPVTADVSVHHLLLDESAVEGFNSQCHVIPPLRGAADREALLAAVADGTIDAVCSQHQPVGSSSKAAPFPSTKPGISGLDTLLPLMLKLAEDGALPLARALDAVTAAPARCLGIQAGHLEPGRPASLCVLAADESRTLSSHWLSAGRNSPWLHSRLPGVVKLTVCQGRVSWLSD